MSNKSVALKILAVLGAVAGGAALVGSDKERIVKFRENLAKAGGLFAGTAARAMQGNDISYANGQWNITPHHEEPAKKLDTFSDAPSYNACPYGIDPDKWANMYYSDQQQYMKLIKMQHDHEIELKQLEVKKAQAEAAAAGVTIETVKEEKEENANEG